MNGRMTGMRFFPVVPEENRVHSTVPESRLDKKRPGAVINRGGKCAPGHTVRFCDLPDQIVCEHPAGLAGRFLPVLLHDRIHRRAVPFRKRAAEQFDTAGSRHVPGLARCRAAAHTGVDSDRREPDVAAVCREVYEEHKQGGACCISRKYNGNMVPRAQPAMRADGTLGFCLKILKKMHRAEMFSRIGLEDNASRRHASHCIGDKSCSDLDDKRCLML